MRVSVKSTRAVLLYLALQLSVCAAELQWGTTTGTWAVNGSRIAASEAGIILSQEWYGATEISGTVEGSGTQSVLVRYAGATESYAISMDRSASKLRLIEYHRGEENQVAEANLGSPQRSPLRFQISARGARLTASFFNAPGAKEIVLAYDGLKVPEGRAGFATRGSSAVFSGIAIKGNAESSFPTYAYHCNYRLSEKVAKEPLWQYLDDLSAELLSRYPRTYRSRNEFEATQKEVRLKIRRAYGLDPWPERNPLKPQLVGVIDRGDHKIEKVIFESQPGFFVNALVYVPKKVDRPLPAVVSPVGHYGDESLFIWSEQGRCIGLVRKGYVVLTYDPISQGERKWIGNGNHDILRRKTLVSGMEVSGLMIWDSMRAIDYLSTRPDVDPERIAITGVSGGGFNTLHTAVLDERVKAAASAGFATTFEALIKRGSAGCCAYTPELARHAEIADLYALIAPRKVLVLGGMMDILSDRILPIAETVKNAYALLDAPDSARYYVDPDAGHTYSKPMRIKMYGAFNKWLKGVDDPAESRESKDPEDSLISRESGLLKILDPAKRGKDVIDLEREFLARHKFRYAKPTNAEDVTGFQKQLRAQLIRLMGAMEAPRMPVVVSDDRLTAPGAVRNIVLKTERNLPVAMKIHHPAALKADTPLLVYFSMEQRYPASDTTSSELIERLKSTGYVVAVPEVRGAGATRVKDPNSVALYSMTLGKHLYSSRIYDLQRVLDYLQSLPEHKSRKVIVWGEGVREGPMALYLAAIDGRVDTVISSHGLVSYQNIVDEDGLPDWDYYVPGLLLHADIPELIAAIAPRRVLVSAPVTINGKVVGQGEVRDRYTWARDVYATLGLSQRLEVIPLIDLIPALQR